MLAVFSFRAYKVARVDTFGSANQRGDNIGRETFTVRDNSVLCLLAQVVNQENTKINGTQLFQQCIHLIK